MSNSSSLAASTKLFLKWRRNYVGATKLGGRDQEGSISTISRRTVFLKTNGSVSPRNIGEHC